MSQATGVMVVGAEGRMGLEVRAALAGEPTLAFAGALERPGHERAGETLDGGVVLRDDPARALEGCGVAIDFSIPAATLANLRAAVDWAFDQFVPESVTDALTDALTQALSTLNDASAWTYDEDDVLAKASAQGLAVERVAALLQQRTVTAGDAIIRQGATGDSLFLVARGVVRVILEQDGGELELATLIAGDFFGEMALLRDEPRTATCRAVTPCALYELRRADFDTVRDACPAIQQALEAVDRQRRAELTDLRDT